MNDINIELPLRYLSIEDLNEISEQLDTYSIEVPICGDRKVANVVGYIKKDSSCILFLERFNSIIKDTKLGLKYTFDKKERKLVERENSELPTILTFDLKNDRGLEFTLKRLQKDGFGVAKFKDSDIHFAFAYGKQDEKKLLRRYDHLTTPANYSVIDVHKDCKLDLENLDLVEYK